MIYFPQIKTSASLQFLGIFSTLYATFSLVTYTTFLTHFNILSSLKTALAFNDLFLHISVTTTALFPLFSLFCSGIGEGHELLPVCHTMTRGEGTGWREGDEVCTVKKQNLRPI